MVFFLKQSVKNGLDLRMEITTPVMRVFMGKMRIYHQNLGGTLYAQKVMVFYGGNVGGTLHEKFVNQKLWELEGRLEHIQTPTFCGFDGGGGGFMSFCFSKQRVIHGGAISGIFPSIQDFHWSHRLLFSAPEKN